MPAAGEEQIGRVLGDRYRLVAPVGAGASAVVFVADDVNLKRRVAVKLLHPSLADDPLFLKRFRAEAQAAAALNHPNVMAVFDWGEERGTPYLVTEYLSGGSLRSMLERNRLLTPSQALMVGLDAARGLDYAHRRGFVHRDIKPANLLFDDAARLRIADFGLARALAEAAWTEPAGVVLGTARYASPEQARGLAVDGKSDVYSLALVLVEAVSGSVPFAADTTVATLMNRIDKRMPVSADLGPLAAVVERAGRPDPAERYSAAELGRALIQSAERLPRPAPLPLVASAPLAGPDETQLSPLSAAAAAPPVHGGTQASPPSGPGPSPTRLAPATAATTLAAPAVPGATMPTPVGEAERRVEHGVAVNGAAASATAPPTTVSPATGSGGGEASLRAGAGAAAGAGATLVTEHGPTSAPSAPAAPSPTSGPPSDPPHLYDGQAEPGRRRRLWWVLAAVLAVVAAVAGFVVYQRNSTPSYPVPPLVGVEIARARNIVSQYDWKVEQTSGRNDTFPKGVVYEQQPADGNLERGGTITLAVSEGPFPAQLPDLVGKDQTAALQLLTEAGLAQGTITPTYDETVPAAVVMSWTVGGQPFAPGTEIAKGTAVDLVVSQGPAPRTIPKLVGVPYDQAAAQLTQLGLVPANAGEVFSDSIGAGLVAAVDPAPGQQVARGATVNMAVSKGPDVVTVPNVIGMDLTTAVATLAQAGLAQGTVSGPIAGKVQATNPGPTAVVKRGTAVEIVLV